MRETLGVLVAMAGGFVAYAALVIFVALIGASVERLHTRHIRS